MAFKYNSNAYKNIHMDTYECEVNVMYQEMCILDSYAWVCTCIMIEGVHVWYVTYMQ